MPEKTDLKITIDQLNKTLEKFTDTEDYGQSKSIDYIDLKEQFIEDFDSLISQPCHYKHKTEAEKLFIILNYGNGKKVNKSLLIKAMSLPLRENSKEDKERDKIVVYMIQRCPYLILQESRQEGYEGMTPLHLAILQDKGVNCSQESITLQMLMAIKEEKDKVGGNKTELSLDGKIATGAEFSGTRMSAGTLLGVAALAGNKKVLDVLIRDVLKNITEQNSTDHDNVLHSLIKHSSTNDSKKHKMAQLNMIKYVLRKAKERAETLLLAKNCDFQTPLQLAAQREEFDIFEFLINHRMYRHVNSNDGLMDRSEYDITDIVSDQAPKDAKQEVPTKRKMPEKSDKTEERKCNSSVLSIIGNSHPPSSACKFVGLIPVRMVIELKWGKYHKAFYAWTIWHMFSLVCLMAGGNLRQTQDENQTEFQPKPLFSHGGIGFCAVIQLLNGLLYTLFLSYASFLLCMIGVDGRFGQHSLSNILSHPYSNAQFAILFPIFGILLFLDFILAALKVKDYDNVLLPFAIIIGCYLCLYFFQVMRLFSVFTVLIQLVVPDLIRFLVVMSVLLVGFSMAMFIVMQGADTGADDDSFENYAKTLMTLLQVMLGVGEINSLFTARKPIAAIFVFVIFVIFTSIMLLNALIAIMSNTCGTISSSSTEFNHKEHYLLQRLSVILQIEDYLPTAFIQSVGKWTANKKRLLLEYQLTRLNDDDHKYSPTRPSKRKVQKTVIEPLNKSTNESIDCSLKVTKTEAVTTDGVDLEKMETITIERN